MWKISKKPVFCLTMDHEWVSEDCLADVLSLVGRHACPLTVFLTHRSKVLASYAKGHPEIHFGLHPNFLSGSSHGTDYNEVLDYCFSLLPGAECFRSHAYYENTHILRMLKEHGILYDSNICLYLQDSLFPLVHASGLIRFPVFWEDDVHFCKQDISWNLSDYLDIFLSPGLKVLNFHPMNIVLNVPSEKYYREIKEKLGEEWNIASAADIRKYVWRGPGTRTFLEEILALLREEKLEVKNLNELYEDYCSSS
jgi:hypothetical protein